MGVLPEDLSFQDQVDELPSNGYCRPWGGPHGHLAAFSPPELPSKSAQTSLLGKEPEVHRAANVAKVLLSETLQNLLILLEICQVVNW
jgi:hypothetical protein